MAPDGDWRTWVPLAGRGWGKTKTGSEWIREQVEGPTPLSAGKRSRIALIAETAADARDVMIKGDSGILASSPPDYRPTYIANRRALVWPNGVEALLFSACDPDQLRGPQFDAAWCDELAKWRYAEYAWDMLQMGLRLGDNPQALVTTTPRPIQVLKDILADPDTVWTQSATKENAANLAESYIKYVQRKYAGTRLGRQELEAAMLDDVPGALWSHTGLDQYRIKIEHDPLKSRQTVKQEIADRVGELDRIVVSVDPPATSGENADACGIIVAGANGDIRAQLGHGFILADETSEGEKPIEWAKRAVKAYHEWKANLIVAEVNNGGEMVETIVRQIDPDIPFKAVRASQGKHARAEPVSAIYDQGRVHHVGTHGALEDQMVAFTPEGLPDPNKSPDRVDALVWAIHELLIVPVEGRTRFDVLD